MKLVLCSEGFHTQNTVDACVELVGKPQDEISVAIINEAYAVDDGGKRWVIDNLRSVADNFSSEIDIVNLLALPIEEVEKKIMAKDVLFVVGGYTDYYMKVMKDTGFDKLLPKILKEKVYVGSSTGSMTMGRRLPSEAHQAIFGGENRNTYGIQDYLGIVDFAIIPHLDSKDFLNIRGDVIDREARGQNFPTYGLRDDAAIVVDGDKVEFIGSEPHMVKVQQ